MTRHRPILVLFLLASLASPTRAAVPASEVPIEQRVVALVFSNSMLTWTGSGFAVGDGRWILTNHHVATRKFGPERYVTAHDAMILSPWSGQAHRARVVAVEQSSDLALLRLENAMLPSLPLVPANFFDRPPVLPRPPVTLFGYPSVADRAGWEASEAAHSARTQAVEVTTFNDVPALLLAPVAGPAKGWSGGPAIWVANGRVVGSFNALAFLPEEPNRTMPQVILAPALRAFLTRSGVDPASLDRGVVPTAARPLDAAAGFRHLMRVTSAAFVDDWETAEREARALTRLRPNSAEAHRILGTTLMGAGKHEAALQALDESKRLDPNAAPTLHQRALALRELRRLPEAEAELQRVVELDPENHEAWLLLGRTLTDRERFAAARDALRRAVRLAPNHPMVRWELAVALRDLGETQEALAEGRIAVDLTLETEPLRPLRIAYARMLARAGRPEEAEKELREAVRLDSHDPGVHLALASFLAETNRKEEARREVEKALALKPDDLVRRAAIALLESLGPAPG